MNSNTDGPDVSELLALNDTSDDKLAQLRKRLAGLATDANILDVAYTTVDSPVGSLLLAATPRGLLRVAFENQDHDAVLAGLAAKVSPRILRSAARLSTAARQIDEYFAGQRTAFGLPLDFALASGFRETVQRALPNIAFGETRSYRQIAEAVGSPRAVRAVGTACATNPLPVVVPCHRVLRSDGSLGGYAGGSEAKTTLLELEKHFEEAH